MAENNNELENHYSSAFIGGGTDTVEIEYRRVSPFDENERVRRYAAFERLQSTEGEKGWKKLTVLRWAQLLAEESGDSSASLEQNLSNILKDVPYKAFFFETKGVTIGNARDKHFEFVLVDSPYLFQFCKIPDPHAFAEYFNQCKPQSTPGISFENLGRNAELVAPCCFDGLKEHHYSHLAAFVRGAPRDQVSGLWKMVAKAYLDRLTQSDDPRPVWLSTSGTGIAWLHFRLDKRPKYYTYREFANER